MTDRGRTQQRDLPDQHLQTPAPGNVQIVEDGVNSLNLSPKTSNSGPSGSSANGPSSGGRHGRRLVVSPSASLHRTHSNEPSIYRRSTSRSRSRGRSTDRTTLDIDNDEFLKKTILRKNPIQRLNLTHVVKRGSNTEREDNSSDEEDYDYAKDVNKYDNSDDEDDSEDEDDNGRGFSDEEQVSDIENDQEVDQELNFEMGSLVLPNFEYNLFSVVENCKPWLEKFKAEHGAEVVSKIKCDQLLEGCYRASVVMGGEDKDSTSRGKPGVPLDNKHSEQDFTNEAKDEYKEQEQEGKSYILYHDLTQECQYALTYVFGTLLKKGDSLFILNIEGTGANTNNNSTPSAKIKPQDLVSNVEYIYQRVKYLYDSLRTLEEKDIQVTIVSVVHPYPKHLLNMMIYALSPVLLVVPLSVMITTLVNYISTVPTLVVRRKLRKSIKR